MADRKYAQARLLRSASEKANDASTSTAEGSAAEARAVFKAIDSARTPQQQEAAARLAEIRRRILFIRMDGDGPLSQADGELFAKEFGDPETLDRSSKLFRALDNIETAREALALVAADLRRLSGWGIKYVG